ncbi:MAG: cation transporter, partial [Bacteroides sp.]|nr:cation transporter [Bacteroides sp.]
MKAKKVLATLVVALLSVTAVMAKDFRTVVFKVEQMECPNCERKVKNNIKYEKGLKDFTTDVKSQTVTITYDAGKPDVKKLKKGFTKFEYEA